MCEAEEIFFLKIGHEGIQRDWKYYLHSFLSSTLDGGERSALSPEFFIPLEGVSVLSELEGGWAPESMWAFWRRGNSFAHVGI